MVEVFFFLFVYTTYGADNIFTFLGGADIRFLYIDICSTLLHGGDAET